MSEPKTTTARIDLLRQLEQSAKDAFGIDHEKLFTCAKCDYYKPYERHDEERFCPLDGSKLKESTREVDEFSQTWKMKLISAVNMGSEYSEFDEWPPETLPNENTIKLAEDTDVK